MATSTHAAIAQKTQFGGLYNKSLYYDGYRCEKFPASIPSSGNIVRVWDEQGRFIGVGVMTQQKRAGSCILVNGQLYDAKYQLWWHPTGS